MAFVRLALFPEGTAEQYGRLARVMAGVPAPAERLLFAAGPVDAGWQVVQVWTSQEHLDRFNEEHLLPALVALGGPPFPLPPVVTDFEAADLALTAPDLAPTAADRAEAGGAAAHAGGARLAADPS